MLKVQLKITSYLLDNKHTDCNDLLNSTEPLVRDPTHTWPDFFLNLACTYTHRNSSSSLCSIQIENLELFSSGTCLCQWSASVCFTSFRFILLNARHSSPYYKRTENILTFFLLERLKKEIYVHPEFVLPFTSCVLYCGNTASVIQGVTFNQISARTETPKKVIIKMTSLISFPFFIQRASFGHKAHFIAPQCNCALSSTRLLLQSSCRLRNGKIETVQNVVYLSNLYRTSLPQMF